ncbi:MAG: cell division protein FtsL [Candidatus Margulisiibacteriota bacterium]|nr:cell division protein FtsL [Candidatus Margulisiibacteriota bacterium]
MKHRRYIFVGIIVGLLAIVHLIIFTNNVSLKYEVAKVQGEFGELYKEHQYLSVVLAEKQSLARIEKIATEQLGMEYPAKINYIIVSREAE